jgi:hypothetical protein
MLCVVIGCVVGILMQLILLDIIHRPIVYSIYNVSETGFCFRLPVDPTDRARLCLLRSLGSVCLQEDLTWLGPIDRPSPSPETENGSIYWSHLNRFRLNTEAKWSLRNIYVLSKRWDNG